VSGDGLIGLAAASRIVVSIKPRRTSVGGGSGKAQNGLVTDLNPRLAAID
jgi:hypothetical protein